MRAWAFFFCVALVHGAVTRDFPLLSQIGSSETIDPTCGKIVASTVDDQGDFLYLATSNGYLLIVDDALNLVKFDSLYDLSGFHPVLFHDAGKLYLFPRADPALMITYNLTTNTTTISLLQPSFNAQDLFFGQFFNNVIYLMGAGVTTEANGEILSTNNAFLRVAADGSSTEIFPLQGLTGKVASGYLDPSRGLGYALTDREIIRVDLNANYSGEPDPNGNYTTGQINLNSTFSSAKMVVDPNTKMAYLYSATFLSSFDLESMTASKSLTFPAGVTSNLPLGTVDLVNGQAFFASSQNDVPSRIFQVGLHDFNLRSTLVQSGVPSNWVQLESGQSLARTITLDQSRDLIYIALSNDTATQVVSLRLPYPCSTLNCSGDQGNCIYGYCQCAPLTIPSKPAVYEYGGPDCASLRCLQDCNIAIGAGECIEGVCICSAIYTNTTCNVRQCPYNCSGNGICSASPNYTCTCQAGFSGVACETPIAYPCDYYADCVSCSYNISCGWCETTKSCVEGDLTSPLNGGCMAWYFQACPEWGINVWPYIFTGVAMILLLINVVSLFKDDRRYYHDDKPDEKQIRYSWWRNQRSAKTWMCLEQIQWTALTCFFAVRSHSLYFNFASIFRWAIIGFPLPWHQLPQVSQTGRTLQSLDQHTSNVLSYQADLLPAFLFWLSILTIVISVMFVILHGMSLCVAYLEAITRARCIHTAIRMTVFFITPSVAYSAWSLYNASSDSAAAPVLGGIVMFLTFLCVVGTWWVIPRKNSRGGRYFNPRYLNRFGALYSVMFVSKAWFMMLVLLKKILLGLALGFLATQEIAQIIVIVLIWAAYLIAVIYFRPFIDAVHFVLEVTLSSINLVTSGLFFAFVRGIDNEEAQVAILGLIAGFQLLSQVLCWGGFVSSWMRMKGIHSIRQIWAAIRGEPNKMEEIDIELDYATGSAKMN